jgi:hypothetical protein
MVVESTQTDKNSTKNHLRLMRSPLSRSAISRYDHAVTRYMAAHRTIFTIVSHITPIITPDMGVVK